MNKNHIWHLLEKDAERIRKTHLRELFISDQERAARFSVSFDDLWIDFSKEKLDAQILQNLLDLACVSNVREKRKALFSGEQLNVTERQAVLHMALRSGAQAPAEDDVAGTLKHFLDFAEDVRQGNWSAESGPFTNVVCLGIGGSSLGPAMAVRGLAPDHDGPNIDFISNVDGAHLTDTLKTIDPAKTLVIISSKTFTTQETMVNARSVRDWLKGSVKNAGRHMVAISANVEEAIKFGIDESRVFGFWDWVGGRYSLWSAVGLPIAIAIGPKKFQEFLAGAKAIDKHFLETELSENLPVLLALVGIWRRNFMCHPTVALIPYDQRLERLPAYVQQLDMESNGKRTSLDNQTIDVSTSPIIFGEAGTNSQHSFFQMLHQGTDIVPVDFLVAATPRESLNHHHRILLANCLAQSQALAFGRSEEDVRYEMQSKGIDKAEIDRLALHRTFPGDRPSTTILYRSLDPYTLGRLIALFEHKIFIQGVIWNINSYDQWGVELGKHLASALTPALEGQPIDGLDDSTVTLLTHIMELQS